MKQLDDELRDALRREPAPEGFAERLFERIDAEERRRTHAFWSAASRRTRLTRWVAPLAAAAAIVAAIGGGMQYRNAEKARAEREAGEAAKAQVMEALRITASKLQLVQAKVREVGS